MVKMTSFGPFEILMENNDFEGKTFFSKHCALCSIIVQNFRKILSEKFLWTQTLGSGQNARFWDQRIFKRNVHWCYLCFLILSNYHETFQKNFQCGFWEKGVWGLKPPSGYKWAMLRPIFGLKTFFKLFTIFSFVHIVPYHSLYKHKNKVLEKIPRRMCLRFCT